MILRRTGIAGWYCNLWVYAKQIDWFARRRAPVQGCEINAGTVCEEVGLTENLGYRWRLGARKGKKKEKDRSLEVDVV